MMKKFIMIYSGNWDDEIDVDGFYIMNKKQMINFIRSLKKYNDPITIDLGTKYSIDYENGKEILEEISFQEISDDEHTSIKKFFGDSNDFGDNLILSIRKEIGVDNFPKFCIKE